MKPSELLEDRSRWSRWHYAVDKNDAPVGVWSPQACRWCLVAAMQRYEGLLFAVQEQRAKSTPTWHLWCQELVRLDVRPAMSLDSLNEWAGYDTVMAVLRESNL